MSDNGDSTRIPGVTAAGNLEYAALGAQRNLHGRQGLRRAAISRTGEHWSSLGSLVLRCEYSFSLSIYSDHYSYGHFIISFSSEVWYGLKTYSIDTDSDGGESPNSVHGQKPARVGSRLGPTPIREAATGLCFLNRPHRSSPGLWSITNMGGKIHLGAFHQVPDVLGSDCVLLVKSTE